MPINGERAWKLVFTLGLIAGAVVVGASWYWMFGLALMGIYLRPEPKIYEKVSKVLDWSTKAAFLATSIVAGSLLYSIYHEPALSQMIVGPLMMLGGGYSAQDRWYFACSHTNGLTATMLGVSTGTIAYIVPGIVATHIFHGASMILLDRRYNSMAAE